MEAPTPSTLLEITAHAHPGRRAAVEAALWGTGAQGVQELPGGGLRIWLAADADLTPLTATLRGLGATIEVEPVENTWAVAPEATPIGTGYAVGPPGAPPPPGRTLIEMTGGLGFGHDGTHPTTRLAFCLLESWLGRFPPASLLDLGTGAGLLAILGARQGAHAVGVDVDSTARQAARANATRNAVTVTVVEALPEAVFEAAVANIRADVLLSLLPALARRVAPGGWLILAGFRAAHAPAVAAALPGWALCEQREEDGWLGQALRRPRPG
ncbi:MAG: 50S ribosomal protein L11 methyltransferase [Myxococcales bacterium]|nr:50S ribosomal protein L11 methyltransferase [Myxococcales bacterium]MCB9523396.1 50S ribosomal protein L11 methyltransferase [Myxococcales bacterium]